MNSHRRKEHLLAMDIGKLQVCTMREGKLKKDFNYSTETRADSQDFSGCARIYETPGSMIAVDLEQLRVWIGRREISLIAHLHDP